VCGLWRRARSGQSQRYFYVSWSTRSAVWSPRRDWNFRSNYNGPMFLPSRPDCRLVWVSSQRTEYWRSNRSSLFSSSFHVRYRIGSSLLFQISTHVTYTAQSFKCSHRKAFSRSGCSDTSCTCNGNTNGDATRLLGVWRRICRHNTRRSIFLSQSAFDPLWCPSRCRKGGTNPFGSVPVLASCDWITVWMCASFPR
jgi:hypothetical protein